LIKIRSITPDRADDYFTLFDNAFSDNPDWAGCYCAFYDDPRPDTEWDASVPGFAERNRENRARTISEGKAHGLMAYETGRPVGWVNAGPLDNYGNLRIFKEAAERGGPSVGGIMCFVIHPDHRGQGVASALLKHVDDYFRDFQLAVAEGYPRKARPDNPDLPWGAAFYKGSPDMYRKAGFEPYRKFDRFVAVRKTL